MSTDAHLSKDGSDGEAQPLRQATGSASAATWWQLMPERLDSELRELDAAGIRYERDEVAEAAGVLRLRVYPIVNGDELPLTATYPDSYPYFAFAVEAPTLDLAHHQHPIGKALCLLPRHTGWWRPESDRLAYFLRDRLELVLRAGSSDDVAAAASVEEHAPEPFSDYYGYEPDTIVLIAAGEDGRVQVPAEASSGVIVIGLEGAAPGAAVPDRLRGALIEVRDDLGNILLRAPEALAARYPARIDGRWSRLAQPVRPTSFDAAGKEVFDRGASADSKPGNPRGYNTPNGKILRVRAVLYPEERRWRGEANAVGDGWAFAVKLQASAAAVPSGRRKRGRGGRQQLGGAPAGFAGPQVVYYLARPGRYAPGDLMARAPELAGLRSHTVAVFGLGCIGAPSAFEFARASVGALRLLDHDAVEPATTLRWPLGTIMAGRYKAPGLAHFLALNYPYVAVTHEQHRIGTPRAIFDDDRPRPDSDTDVMARMLDGATLVYDATAEWGVQRFLAEEARLRGLSYVGVEGSPGAWGGMVVRIVPGKTEGCWLCLQHWRGEKPENGGITPPPHDPVRGDVHPEGCADPTYTGANFDLGEIAFMGVRTAIATMIDGADGGYPPVSWDVAVLKLRDADGRLTAPRWTTYRLARHPACRECGRREWAR